MSASALNAAFPPSPGLTAGPGAGASQTSNEAKGPLVGFEALLASLFGAEPQPGTVAPGAKIKASKDTVAADVAPAEGDIPATGAGEILIAKSPEDIKAAEAAAAALAFGYAGLALPVAAAPTPVVETTGAEGEAAKAAVVSDVGKRAAKTVLPAFPNEAPPVETAETTAAGADLKANPDRSPADSNGVTARARAKLDAPFSPKTEAPTLSSAAPTPPRAPSAAPAEPPPASLAPADAAAIATAVQGQAASQAFAKIAEETAPATAALVAAKDKAQSLKPAQGEHAPADAEPPAALAKASAPMVTAITDGPPKGGADDHPAQANAADVKTKVADAPAGSADAGVATASTTNASTLIHPALIPVRGSPQTVANLAAQIAKKLEGRLTRFDLELNPQGLGRVDVRMEIGATGRISAAMTFDTPAAAAELRARANELQRHLEQAGFDLSGGLSFDVAGDRGQGRQTQHQQSDSEPGQAFRGRAFQQALATADGAAQSAVSGALNLRRGLISGVDVRI